MAGELALTVLIQGQDALSSMIRQIGNNFGPLGMGMAAIGVAAVGAGIAAVKMAGDFQQGTTALITSAGKSAANIDMVRQGILNLSVSTATSTQQLTEGMYMIESAGFHGAAGLQVLTAAAEGAKAENADLGAVANTVTSALNAYAWGADHATSVTNSLVATVASGKMHMQDLATSLANVLPAASAAGVGLYDVEGAIATMTMQGDNAANASTHLRQLILALISPSKAGATSLKEIGMTTQQVSDEMKKSLPATIEQITTALNQKFPASAAMAVAEFAKVKAGGESVDTALAHLSKNASPDYITALKNIAGGSKQMMAILELSGSHLQAFGDNVKFITGKVQEGGNTIDGFNLIQGELNFKLTQVKMAVDALMISLGSRLLPVLTPIVGGIAQLITGFTAFLSTGKSVSPMVQNITGMFGVMSYNWQSFGATIKSILGGPLQQFGQVMGQLLPGFISQFLGASNDVQLVMQDVGIAVASIVAPALKVLGQAFKGAQGFIETTLNALEGQFLPALHNLLSAIAPGISAILQWIASSNILGITFSALSIAVRLVIGAASLLINIGSAIIAFFTQTEVGAALLKGILAALGAIILVVAITSIPAMLFAIGTMLVGFATWIAGAIAVGIANVIAFWPIILIILAIVAVVAIVVLAVQHWGAISAWLSNAWKVSLSAIGAAFSWLGTHVRDIATGIKNFFGNIFSGLGTKAHEVVTNIGGFFSGLGTHVHNGVDGAKNAFHSGMTGIQNFAQTSMNAVVGSFKWLYNHNYYFKNLVDSITSTWKNGVKFWTGVWHNFTAWIGGVWNGTKNLAITVWGAVSSFFSATWQTISSTATTVWNAITSFLSGVWKTISSAVSTAWNAITSTIATFLQDEWRGIQIVWNKVVSFLQGIWKTISTDVGNLWTTISNFFVNAWSTYIATPLSNLWNRLTSWFGNLAKTAADWGKNLIQGFINGITGMLSNVASAAGNVASTVAKFLGFHSPAAEGEGRHIIEWGQNMVKAFVQGMALAQPTLNAQVQHMIAAPNLPQGGNGNTNNTVNHGPMTISVNISSPQVDANSGNQIATVLGNRLRAQFGNIG